MAAPAEMSGDFRKARGAELPNAENVVAFFQPIRRIVGPDKSELIGFEALARIVKGTRPLPPQEYIDSLHSPQRPLFDLHMFRQACAFVRQAGEGITVNVNFHRRTLGDHSLPDKLLEICEHQGVRSSSLKIEILESPFHPGRHTEAVSRTIKILNENGHRIAIDDVPEGESIDRITMEGVTDVKMDKHLFDEACQAELAQLTALIRRINPYLEITMEGVASKDHQQLAIDLGANFVQGYYYGPAGSQEKMLAMVAANSGIIVPSNDASPPIII